MNSQPGPMLATSAARRTAAITIHEGAASTGYVAGNYTKS